MNPANLKKIAKNADDKDMALLAQEMGFLVERFDDFKKQTESDFTELKSNTSGNYASKTDVDYLKERVARLERGALWVLGTTFALVFTAVVGLVVLRK